MEDFRNFFITWTTYGNWVPGDWRGWRHRTAGPQLPKPLLERWARKQMVAAPVLLGNRERELVEQTCRKHCEIRGWHLHAVRARSNHVHAVVGASAGGAKVRDQLKANCTRALREQGAFRSDQTVWGKGGDTEILDTDEDLEAAVRYVLECQDAPRDDLPSWRRPK